MGAIVIVKVWGGIGNQLFQYVFGQYIHYRYDIEVRYDNNSFFTTDKLRQSELSALDEATTYDNRCTFSRYRGIKNRLLRYMYQMYPKQHFINELAKNKIPKYFKEGHLYFFQGYWQDIHYYKWLRKHIPNFNIGLADWPKDLCQYKSMIGSCANSVSVHIRRGDYFSPKNIGTYGVCDAEYFQRAILYIQEKLQDYQLFVFSDDMNWVKQNISFPHDAVIIENYDVPQLSYIYLMSLCCHHIISNSSFSWWGAVLNEQPRAIVIAPNHWTLTSAKTIALEKWTKL